MMIYQTAGLIGKSFAIYPTRVGKGQFAIPVRSIQLQHPVFRLGYPEHYALPTRGGDHLAATDRILFVTDRRQFEHPAEQADEFHPVRKIYIHGDERSAAEDMAYVWFNVWKFPVDWRLYVTAAAFHEDTDWENGHPID